MKKRRKIAYVGEKALKMHLKDATLYAGDKK